MNRFFFIIGLLLPSVPVLAAPFVSPIGGTPYQDWTIVNYVDLLAGTGKADYLGGNYTYNGHNAIDYTLPNFAAMDRGVTVNAAQAGTVVNVHDGEFDRWSRINPNPGHRPNYVVIEHSGGIVTEYLHLKKNSISVSIGESVVAGQQIGFVGSSGNSSDAHLHFAVYENGQRIETYQDPTRWWSEPLRYAGDVSGALDHGVTDHVPTLEELVNRPVDNDLFLQSDGPGQRAYIWANLHGFDAGDSLDYFFYRPDGTEYSHLHWNVGQIRFGWWTGGIRLPNTPDLGTWSIDVRRNGNTFINDQFVVSVPEPQSLALLMGVSSLILSCRRIRRA